ncbi:MAG: hypothetical protein NTY10_00300, partial [Candidatus Omnitrophica bacterium]|nr:hypothetical protein [Candidatus Omnitrophota bacterium]
MNKIEKNDSRSLKREKLKTFLSERRAQKGAQATARKETARRFKSEQRARLVSERVQVRQQKEALKAAKIQSRIKINSAERSSGEEVNPSFPAPAVKGEKEKVISKEDLPAPKKLSRPEKRRQLLLYLTKLREAKAEGLVHKKEEKKAAVIKKQALRTEAESRKQSRRQPKPIAQAQKKENETIPAVIGQAYKRQQLLSYLKKRKAGAKTFAVQRRELKKITGADIPEVTAIPVVPEVIPVIMPLAVPAITPPEISGVAPEKIAEPGAVEPVVAETEKPVTRRFKLPLAKGKKIPSEAASADIIKKPSLPKKSFKIVPFLKAHSVKIIFGLLVLGWFVEIAMLNKRLENVRQQVERASSIARPRASNEVIASARALPPNVGTTRVEGIR